MPLATPQGTLDFKSVDTITFVGASSNTVIDTTTGSFGVGVDANGPTSNLHVVGDALITGNVADLNIVSNVNMLHTSNTASIKLNSNVVTEFPRSKKLMKFPRVALTSAAQTGSGYQDYYVTRSSQFSGYNAWEAFDEYNPVGGNTGAGAGWASTIPGTYSVSTGAETGTVQHHSGSVQGEWIQIQLPESIYLHDFVIESRSETNYGADGYDNGYPKSVVLYGSINGSSWVEIKQFTTGLRTFSEAHTENINETTHVYKYFALVVNTTQVVNNTTQVSHTAIGQIKLYGVPEYDPEAHGVDVVVKSVPNVPNTDWLEVYYDAKDLADGAVSTTSGAITGLGGTTNNGTAFGDPQVSNGAFVFDGTGDYISGTLPSSVTGEWVHSASTWFKASTYTGNIIFIGNAEASAARISIIPSTTGQITIGISGSNVKYASAIPLDYGWHHLTYTYAGGAAGLGAIGYKLYVDGVNIPQTSGVGSGTLNLPTGPNFYVGSGLNGGSPFTGSIANFRLFNRALTSDEIYQLYAYQKEYFGHGTLGMTLKAGRLGIGTSEPRAALDVRGDIIGGCPVLFDCVAQSTTNVGSYVDWNLVKLNKGDGLSGTTFTAPVAGHYFFHVHGMGVWTFTAAETRFVLEWHKNGVHYSISSYVDAQMYDARDCVDADGWHMKLSGSIIAYLEIGETIQVQVDSTSTSTLHGRYNRFTGHYIG